MNKIVCLFSVVISFMLVIVNLNAEGYVFSDEASEVGLDTTTVCVVKNDTITIQWINGFPIQGTYKKTDGIRVQINYLNSSSQHENNTYLVSALAAPVMHSNNSIDIMLMNGTGALKIIDIKTGNVALEEFIPAVPPEIELECVKPPEEREKMVSSGMHPYGFTTGKEVPHLVNYAHLPAGAYFMVIFNQNNEVLFVKTIRKGI